MPCCIGGPSRLNILDIGCAFGTLVNQSSAVSDAYEVFGIDIDKEKIATSHLFYPTNRSHIFFGSALNFTFEMKFDVIVMFDVIDHLPEPEIFMGKIVRDLLVEGGIFVFQTPNRFTNSIKETIEWRSFTSWRSEHCSLQTRKSIVRLLHRSGLSQVELPNFHPLSNWKIQKLDKFTHGNGRRVWDLFGKMPKGIYPNIWGYAIKDCEF